MDFFNCPYQQELVTTKKLKLNGVNYTVCCFMVIDLVHEDIPVFLDVKYILACDGCWCLAGSLVICDQYIPHYFCYSLKVIQQFIVLSPGNEIDYHALDAYNIIDNHEEKLVVALHHRLIKKQ